MFGTQALAEMSAAGVTHEDEQRRNFWSLFCVQYRGQSRWAIRNWYFTGDQSQPFRKYLSPERISARGYMQVMPFWCV